MFSIVPKWRSLRVNFSFGNRKKSQGLKSGEYGKCGRTEIPTLTKNWMTVPCDKVVVVKHPIVCNARSLAHEKLFFWDVPRSLGKTVGWQFVLEAQILCARSPDGQRNNMSIDLIFDLLILAFLDRGEALRVPFVTSCFGIILENSIFIPGDNIVEKNCRIIFDTIEEIQTHVLAMFLLLQSENPGNQPRAHIRLKFGER